MVFYVLSFLVATVAIVWGTMMFLLLKDSNPATSSPERPCSGTARTDNQ